VVERREPLRSGKGYALNHGLQALRADPPDVLVIIDADCVAEAGLIDTIGRLAIATDRPVQAAFLVEPPVPATANDRLSALAFTVKNLVRPRGLERLGLPCLLTGAGTAIPWAAMSSTTINGAASAEDMRLTAQLACLGHLPMHCHSARVTAGLSAAPRGGVSLQRTRWEHGHLETLLTEGPRLLSAAMRQRRAALLALALELCVPPLSLLVLLWAAAFSAALIAGLLGASMVPAALLALCGLLLVLGLSAAWIKFGRHVAPLRLVLAWPFYVLAKVPLYVAFLTRRQSTWAPRQ